MSYLPNNKLPIHGHKNKISFYSTVISFDSFRLSAKQLSLTLPGVLQNVNCGKFDRDTRTDNNNMPSVGVRTYFDWQSRWIGMWAQFRGPLSREQRRSCWNLHRSAGASRVRSSNGDVGDGKSEIGAFCRNALGQRVCYHLWVTPRLPERVAAAELELFLRFEYSVCTLRIDIIYK